MTHEYVIAVGGLVEPTPDERDATAVGWAADAILAIGTDAEVSAISRGDSTFVDVSGCTVTPLPLDLSEARAVVAGRPDGNSIGRMLAEAGLLGPVPTLEVGTPADLAFWADSELRAVVRGGAFTEGDEHCGPFPRADRSPRADR